MNRTAQYRLVTTRVMWLKSKSRGSAQLPGFILGHKQYQQSAHSRSSSARSRQQSAHLHLPQDGRATHAPASQRSQIRCLQFHPLAPSPMAIRTGVGDLLRLKAALGCTPLLKLPEQAGAVWQSYHGGRTGSSTREHMDGCVQARHSKNQPWDNCCPNSIQPAASQKREDGKRPHGKRAARHQTRARSV